MSSSGPIEIELTGHEQLMEIFEKLPEKWGKKPIMATLRKGATSVRKQIKQNFPSQIKQLEKAVNIKAGRGLSLSVGVFGKKGYVTLRDGRDYDVYFPIYWFNYGTYARRDGSHRFQRARKSITVKRSGGIHPANFIERSWEQSRSQAEQIINSELQNETVKFLKKHAVND